MKLSPSRAASLVGCLAFALWLLFALRLGDRYPLADFTMFAEPITMPSRVMVKTSTGDVREVFELGGWSCPPDMDLNPDGPAPFFYSRDVDQSVIMHIRGSAGEGAQGEPVTLIRRIFLLTGEGPEVVGEVPLATCRARLEGSG